MSKIRIESVFYFEDIDLSVFIEVNKNTNQKTIEKLANIPKKIYLKENEIILDLDKKNRLWPLIILNNEKEKYSFSYLKEESKNKKPCLSSDDYVKSEHSIREAYINIKNTYLYESIIFDPLCWTTYNI